MKIDMIKSYDYDQYAFMILNCNSVSEIDTVMFHASEDSFISHKEFISLTLLAKQCIASFER